MDMNHQLVNHRTRLILLFFISVIAACSASHQMSADAFVERLKKADFEIQDVNTVDTHALENNRYIRKFRTVMASGILVSIMEFEDESMASTYRIKFDQLPDPYATLPGRMKSMLGNTRIIQHYNLVIRLVENLSGKQNSAEADRIIEIIQDL